jgi:adenylate cyclase
MEAAPGSVAERSGAPLAAPADQALPESVDGRRLASLVTFRLRKAAAIANGLGAVTVFVLVGFLIPQSVSGDELWRIALFNALLAAPYTAANVLLGSRLVRRRFFAPIEDWLAEERPATEEERALVLRYPLEAARISARFWFIGAVGFALVNIPIAIGFAASVGATILLGGVSTCALAYLLIERILRPVTARALAGGDPPAGTVPGVTVRLTMAWLLATGVPLLGMVMLAIASLTGADLYGNDEAAVAAATLFLAGVALLVGLFGSTLAARSVADPIAAVRDALAEVERGRFDVRVPVDDGSEVGLLEAGFNRMAAGLGERERLRDLFGRHVGREVASAALDREAGLGGEVRDVAVLFVDLVGSTSLAAKLPPTEVVSLLNEFFRLVVETCEQHGGWVNKFEGDAALCVFGAPTDRQDPAGEALAAARTLSRRLAHELPGVDVGIGVSAGPAVAGNVGAEERFEYTVIGDPVNEAARLCELAKRRPERLLASETAVARARGTEADAWRLDESVTLRGRPSATRLAVPSADPS